ncbi:hypothetical protein M758_8G165500 [Ceratodon purpureus]|nr:hypothetical protein M758_8G165500 [Ceratodon purpureus]
MAVQLMSSYPLISCRNSCLLRLRQERRLGDCRGFGFWWSEKQRIFKINFDGARLCMLQATAPKAMEMSGLKLGSGKQQGSRKHLV